MYFIFAQSFYFYVNKYYNAIMNMNPWPCKLFIDTKNIKKIVSLKKRKKKEILMCS